MLGSKFTDELGTQISFVQYQDTVTYVSEGRKYGVSLDVVRKGDLFKWRICLPYCWDLETLVPAGGDLADKMRADIAECANLAGLDYEFVEKLF